MKKEIKTLLESKTFGTIIIGIGIFFVVGLIFATGVRVGYHKARFAGAFGDNYERTFRGPNRHIKEDMLRELPSGHGVSGKVISIALPNIVVLDRDGTEKTIVTTDKTVARRFRDTVSLQDLKVDEFIVAIGTPDEASKIEAGLIRILPEPPIKPGSFNQSTNGVR